MDKRRLDYERMWPEAVRFRSGHTFILSLVAGPFYSVMMLLYVSSYLSEAARFEISVIVPFSSLVAVILVVLVYFGPLKGIGKFFEKRDAAILVSYLVMFGYLIVLPLMFYSGLLLTLFLTDLQFASASLVFAGFILIPVLALCFDHTPLFWAQRNLCKGIETVLKCVGSMSGDPPKRGIMKSLRLIEDGFGKLSMHFSVSISFQFKEVMKRLRLVFFKMGSEKRELTQFVAILERLLKDIDNLDYGDFQSKIEGLNRMLVGSLGADRNDGFLFEALAPRGERLESFLRRNVSSLVISLSSIFGFMITLFSVLHL